jgi:hypothetical protein
MLNLCGIVATILKMVTARNFPMSGINSGHHYLPTYQIVMISDNVEFLPLIFMPCFGSHFENGRHLENFENCPSNGDLSLCQILCLYHYPVTSLYPQKYGFDPIYHKFENFRINWKHISIAPLSFMKFCPVVPEICRGQVHA